jgi:MinD superfamily P-loop ATPase
MKIAVASGKGGTGKTFISTNLFRSLLSNGYDAVLADCDAEAPDALLFFSAEKVKATVVSQHIPVIDTDACTYCGKCHDYCNYNAIFIIPPARIINVIEDLCHDCGACSVACSFNAITEKKVPVGEVSTWEIKDKHIIMEARTRPGVMSPVPVIKRLINDVRDNKAIIILDSPPGTSCPFIHTVASADYVILVTEPTPFGLSDLKQSIATLKTIDKKFGVIINRSDIGNNELKKYLNDNSVPLLLEIPFSRSIAEKYSEGKTIADTDKKFEAKLLGLVKKIIKKNGDSRNKW